MNDIQELETAVMAYIFRHDYKPQYIKYRPDEKYYYVRTFDFTELEAQIVEMRNRNAMVIFKVNGKVTSIYD